MKVFFLIFTIMFLIQWVLKQLQLKEFYRHYNALITDGDVLVGRYKGAFAGGIVLLQLDKQEVVKEAIMMKGITSFGKFKPLPQLNGMLMQELGDESFEGMKKHEIRSLQNAVENWEQYKQDSLESAEV